MIDAITSLLQGDATVTAALTGGVHRANEISRQGTPTAYDANGELLPCALVRQESGTPWGPHEHSGRLYVVVVIYQRSGLATIETARKRVYALLHRQKLTPVDGSGCYEVRWSNDVLDQEDPALGVSMALSRYVATVQRQGA